jgi:hypothetical protein
MEVIGRWKTKDGHPLTTRKSAFCDTSFATLTLKLPQSIHLRQFLRPLSPTAAGLRNIATLTKQPQVTNKIRRKRKEN